MTLGATKMASGFVVLEFIDGHPLDQELRSHNLPSDRFGRL